EEEFLHLAFQELARLRVDGAEAILVDEHGLVPQPLLPAGFRDVLEDALAELAGIGLEVQAFGALLQHDAINHACHHVLHSWNPKNAARGCASPVRRNPAPPRGRHGTRRFPCRSTARAACGALRATGGYGGGSG